MKFISLLRFLPLSSPLYPRYSLRRTSDVNEARSTNHCTKTEADCLVSEVILDKNNIRCYNEKIHMDSIATEPLDGYRRQSPFLKDFSDRQADGIPSPLEAAALVNASMASSEQLTALAERIGKPVEELRGLLDSLLPAIQQAVEIGPDGVEGLLQQVRQRVFDMGLGNTALIIVRRHVLSNLAAVPLDGSCE